MLSDLKFRLRALFHRSAVEDELNHELRFHLEREAEKLAAAGLAPDEAMRRARLEFGGVERFREEAREARGVWLLETMLADVRYALRRIVAAPVFSVVTTVTLALGIGSTTAIFSAIHPVLIAPLPYPDADRLAMIWERNSDGSNADGTFGMYRELAARTRTFDHITAIRSWTPTITGADRPERFDGQRVSASYFQVLGVRPHLGRDFTADDDRDGAPNVTIISHDLWQRRFGGDSAIVGRLVTLGDAGFTIIGVMPERFENVLSPQAHLWTTLKYDMSQGRAWGHHLRLVGRLRSGVAPEEATRELTQLGQAVLRELRPQTYGDSVRIAAVPLRHEITAGVRPALLAIAGAVVLVLLIACVNVTNLVLARGVQRRGEFALRAVLGAGQGRLVRQLLTESMLLSLAGGAAGLLVAESGIRALQLFSPPELPRLSAIALNGPVFVFALLVTSIIGLVIGLVPALEAARGHHAAELPSISRRTTGGHRRLRSMLVVAEVALALVLLIGSGLLLRSMRLLFTVDPGFEPAGVLTMQVQTAGSGLSADSSSDLFYARALDAVRRVPGVSEAALTSQLPLSGDRDEYGVMFAQAAQGFSTLRYAVSPGYLEAMRIPVRRGRVITENDRAGAPMVALINESFARRTFAGSDPIGAKLTMGPLGPFTIVGIVGDVRQLSLAGESGDAVYVPAAQWTFADNAMWLVARGSSTLPALAPAIRDAIWSVDRNQAIVRTATLPEMIQSSAAERRFSLLVFESFALAALLLAAAGIYGVLAGGFAERRREIGVRAALGATRGTIIAFVVREGLVVTFAGVGIGIIGAVLASQALGSLLFGIGRFDVVTWLSVIALLGAVALVACALPAWRAARVDPVSTLRSE